MAENNVSRPEYTSMEEQPRLITLNNISKEYDGVTVLDHINLYIRKKEFVTLLGPSGCGKTTTLLQAPREHCVPEVRAFSPPECGGQYRLRA